MKKLELNQIGEINGGDYACDYATGAMCIATIALANSVFFAPMAAATGIGCLLGIYGCY